MRLASLADWEAEAEAELCLRAYITVKQVEILDKLASPIASASALYKYNHSRRRLAKELAIAQIPVDTASCYQRHDWSTN